jgi:hypothetical protein
VFFITFAVMIMFSGPVAEQDQEPPPCDGVALPWKGLGVPKGVWREREFWSQTKYVLEPGAHSQIMRASCRAAASGRYYEFFEAQSVGGLVMCWSWNAIEFPQQEDLHTKKGDDRAAAVCAVFNKSRLPWRSKAIFYVWSGKHPEGTVIENAYAPGVKMLVLRQGTQGWVTEKRNLAEDYIRVFGELPPMLEAVAIFTDSDNTAGRAEALYGPIVLQYPGK